MRVLLFVVLVFLSSGASAASPDQSKQISTEVVTEFVQACFRRFPFPDEFSAWLKQHAYQKLSKQKSEPFLANRSDEAWAGRTPNSEFILVTSAHSACTVFAAGLDEKTTIEMVKGFLGYLETQGATWSERDTTSAKAGPGYSSTDYSIVLDGRAMANITLSIAPPRPDGFQFALTVARG